MRIVRIFGSGVVLAALAFFAVAMLPGCGDGSGESGTTVKVDPDEAANRAQKIQDMYKSGSQQKRSAQAPPGPGAK